MAAKGEWEIGRMGSCGRDTKGGVVAGRTGNKAVSRVSKECDTRVVGLQWVVIRLGLTESRRV